MKYEIRPFRADDLDYVYDSWLNQWRASRWAGVVPNHLYYPTQRALIDGLIARGAVILVADEGRTLLGWACGEVKDGRTVLHYARTKDPYAQWEIDRALVAALPGEKPGFLTHWLPRYAKDGWTHAPEMARRKDL